MARKIYVEVKTRLIIEIEEGIEFSEVMADMDYNFTSQTDGASVIDSEIIEQEITDSK